MTRALRCQDPVLFLEHRELMAVKGPVPVESYEIEFGKARVARAGSDVTVVALALMVQRTLAAAELLTKKASASKSSTREPSRRWIPTRSLLRWRRPAGCSSSMKRSPPAASGPKSPHRSPTLVSTISMRRSAG